MACENPIEIAAPFQKLRHGPAISNTTCPKFFSWQKSLECDASQHARAGWPWSAYNANNWAHGHLRCGIDPRHFQLRTASYEGEKKKRDLVASLVAVILSSFVKRRQRKGEAGSGPAHQAPKRDATIRTYFALLCFWCPSLPPSLPSSLP